MSKLSIKQHVVFRTSIKYLGKIQRHVYMLKSNWGNAYKISCFQKRPTERQLREHMRSTKRHFTTRILNSDDPNAMAQCVMLPEYRISQETR